VVTFYVEDLIQNRGCEEFPAVRDVEIADNLAVAVDDDEFVIGHPPGGSGGNYTGTHLVPV
jgi:hypothetical protein